MSTMGNLYEDLKKTLYDNPLWKKIWEAKTPEQIFNIHWDTDLTPETRKSLTDDVIKVLKFMAVTYYYLGFNSHLVMTSNMLEGMKKKGKVVDPETLNAFLLEKVADFCQKEFDATEIYGTATSPCNSILKFIAEAMMRKKDVLNSTEKCNCPFCVAARNLKNKDLDVTKVMEEEMNGCGCATPSQPLEPDFIKIVKLKGVSDEDLDNPEKIKDAMKKALQEEAEKENVRNQSKNN